MVKQTRDAWGLEVQEWLNETYKSKPGFESVPEDGGSVTGGQEYTIPLVAGVEMKIAVSAGMANTGDYNYNFDIVEGKLSPEAKAEVENIIGEGTVTNSIVAHMDEMVVGVSSGNYGFNFGVESDGTYYAEVSVSSEGFEYEGTTASMNASIAFRIKPTSFTKPIVDALEKLADAVSPAQLAVIIGLVLGAIGVGIAFGGAYAAGLIAALFLMANVFEDIFKQITG